MMNKLLHPDHQSVLFLCVSYILQHESFKHTSLNINRARDTMKRSLLFQKMKLKRTDVMFLLRL